MSDRHSGCRGPYESPSRSVHVESSSSPAVQRSSCSRHSTCAPGRRPCRRPRGRAGGHRLRRDHRVRSRRTARARERAASGPRERARRCHGSLVFRELTQGAAYFIREPRRGDDPGHGAAASRTTRRRPSTRAQTLVEGLNYIQMRDGTLLAAMVRPPLGQDASAQGHRFPTVVEYSGYAAADPDNPQPSTLLAQRARLRDGRGQHARLRLLGRRASTSSTSRRPPTATTSSRRSATQTGCRRRQGRHGRHLVPRHQPDCSSPARSRRTSPRSHRSR